MNKEMLDTKEVAEYLNIHEKQVYKLIKEKKLPATRITGKWTFPKRLIEEWIIRSAEENTKRKGAAAGNHIVAMGSHDFAIEILSHNLSKLFPEFSLSLSNVGSEGGLIALNKGICHLASCHLFDPATGTYNMPFLPRYLPDRELAVINLVYRDLGLLVKKGNPLSISGIEDVARPEVSIINRQQGSGTRIFFDAELVRRGISPQRISGYTTEVNTHNEAAIAVLSGSADAALGICSAAKMLGLEFKHLTKERYDLIIPKENLSYKPIAELLKIIRSEEFKIKINQLGGYDTKNAGEIMNGLLPDAA
ncbi:MAG: substrate-binding domain-containing protein [Pseudomonadota bacterium]